MWERIIKMASPLWTNKHAETSSFVFKLVTKYTVYMLLLFVLIIGGKQLLFESTTCFIGDKVREDVMDYSCWIKGDFDTSWHNQYSYSVGRYGSKILQQNSYNASNPNYQGEKYLKIGFYGWIVPLLVIQALCLLIPRVHWHYKQEQNIPKSLKMLPTNELTDDWINQRTQLISYFKNIEKSHHQLFAIKYLFCEFITIILNSLVMLFMNLVIDDFWNEYQSAATSFLFLDFSRFYQASSRLFPKQASCNFYTIEVSGHNQHINSVCNFHQNGTNARVFAILYIWYIFILTWSVLHLLVLIALYSFRCLRFKHISRMLGRPSTTCECMYLSKNGDYGLWFTLRIFRRNMHLAQFQDLCISLLSEASDP